MTSKLLYLPTIIFGTEMPDIRLKQVAGSQVYFCRANMNLHLGEKDFYEGAGHGFVRQQDGRNGANLEAVRRAWPKTIGWFRQHLEGGR